MASKILLLDEALTSLDGFNQKKILDLIESFRNAGKTVIISTHSMETAALADQVGIMAEGKLAAFGSPREIFGCCWDSAWGLSLPWIVSVSRRLSDVGLVPPQATPFTAEELLTCLRGTPVSENKQAVSVNSGQPFPPKTGRAKRRKTGIEFFRMASFEELPPGSSPLQNMNGGLKLLLLLLFAAATLILPPPFSPLGILTATIAAGWFFGKIWPGRLLQGFFRILPWLLIVCTIQLALHFYLMRPLALILRIGTLSALLSLFYAVTPLREFIGIFNRLFSFFALFGFPARDFSLAMGIALRFIPILSEEAENIVCAQLSRGGKKGRVRMAAALAVPLFLRALERADALAKAMTLRCYRREKLHDKCNKKRMQ
jgi:energy-coupling factor transporter transmembrane protein EcfT